MSPPRLSAHRKATLIRVHLNETSEPGSRTPETGLEIPATRQKTRRLDRRGTNRSDTAPRGNQRQTGKGDFEESGEKSEMRFQGTVYRDEGFWLAEVPIFEAMTQGRTRREALEMIRDWFRVMVDRKGFSVDVHLGARGEFEISSSDLREMIRFLLQRQRQQSGLSLADAAERLGAKSRNSYARYERGESLPTIEKLDQLLKAVSGNRDFVLKQSVTG